MAVLVETFLIAPQRLLLAADGIMRLLNEFLHVFQSLILALTAAA